ncbi:MAG TPA: pilus assembly protein TadG-related protein [Rhizomicrobium sp.]|jgi:Flp pilus assembly protein TadG|nr:pilus assembly protein TadG-related protein [Rhizomicrobium sp.]
MTAQQRPIKTARRILARLASRSGNVSMMFAFSLPVIIGICGLGVDVGYWHYQARGLQTAADAAAYDGVVALNGGGNASTITTAATKGATDNGWSSSNGTIAVHSPPTSGTHQDAYSVQVVLTQNVSRFFSALYSSTPVPESATAVATIAGNSVCILALNATAANEISISGNANVQTDCDIVGDSSSSSAIDMAGAAQVTTPCAVTVGTAITTSGLTLTKCTSVTTHAQTVADPYATVPQPALSGTCLTVPLIPLSLSPGWYCHGLSLASGPVTFQPGLYVVSGGNLILTAGAIANGTGVTFFIANGYSTTVDGHAVLNLSAPTSGTYSGVLFFGDRSYTSGTDTITGGSTSTITGAIYFPTQAVTYAGNGGSGTCVQLVAGTITITGTAGFTHTCPGTGMTSFTAADGQAGATRLAE